MQYIKVYCACCAVIKYCNNLLNPSAIGPSMTFKFQNDASSNISCIPLFAPEWHLQSSDPTKIPAISFNTVYSAAPQFTTSLACQFKYAANLESNLQVTSASRSVFSTFDVLMRQSLCPQKSTLQEQISPQNLRKNFLMCLWTSAWLISISAHFNYKRRESHIKLIYCTIAFMWKKNIKSESAVNLCVVQAALFNHQYFPSFHCC